MIDLSEDIGLLEESPISSQKSFICVSEVCMPHKLYDKNDLLNTAHMCRVLITIFVYFFKKMMKFSIL